MKRTLNWTHNVCCLLKAAFTLVFLGSGGTVWARPPYQVIAYVYQTTDAPTNSVNDNGQGANINWTTGVPWNDITMVNDAFFQPNTNDTFSNGGEKGTVLIDAAHAQGERCNVAIGGGGQDGAFSTLCLAANREAFASAVTALIMQYGYDGAEIDWETVTDQQADATDMMEDLYRDIKALPDSSVDGNPRTLSFTTNPAYSGIYDMSTLADYTDWCFFMGYDWYDTPATYANGPLNGVNPDISGSIEGMTNGSEWSYPASKMILGCPLYTDDYNAGTEIDTLSILHLGTAGAYNSSYAEQAYSAPDGDTVYVDTAQSYCDKINWAQSQGLMGIGMWDLAQALPYTDSAVTEIWNTIGGNASCLSLGPTATATITPTPVVSSSWRIVAGGPSHTDCQNNVWAADENYVGGTPATSTNTITGALPCSSDQALYQDQRYGSSFSYVFNVPAGSYQVTLKFAETYFTAAGDREFDVAVNGVTELTNFDIFAAARGENIAVDKVFNNIAPSGGALTIAFGPSAVNNAMVQSIQVIPQPATATLTPTSTLTSTMSATATLTVTSTLTKTATSSSTATPTNTPVLTGTSNFTMTPTVTFTRSSTPTSTYTFSSTPTLFYSPTLSSTPTNTLTGTLTPLNTATSTSTPTRSDTPTSSGTPTRTFTVIESLTVTPTWTPTDTPSATKTPTWTATLSPTATLVWTDTNTDTPTPEISTSTGTPTPTAIPSGCSGIPNWNGNGVSYSAGEKVDYNGEIYQSIQAHISQPNAEPPVMVALWRDEGPCGSTPTSSVALMPPVVYPNPVRFSTTNIQLPLMNATNLKVKIYTLAMREVQTIQVPQVMGNTLSVQLIDKEGNVLANGLYYFVIQVEGQHWMSKVLVLR